MCSPTMPTAAYAYAQNPHMPILPQSNLHLDILMGRDEALECADFMMPGMYLCAGRMSIMLICCVPASETTQPLDIHADMEKKLRM